MESDLRNVIYRRNGPDLVKPRRWCNVVMWLKILIELCGEMELGCNIENLRG